LVLKQEILTILHGLLELHLEVIVLLVLQVYLGRRQVGLGVLGGSLGLLGEEVSLLIVGLAADVMLAHCSERRLSVLQIHQGVLASASSQLDVQIIVLEDLGVALPEDTTVESLSAPHIRDETYFAGFLIVAWQEFVEVGA
jgi:hypothetical protein